MPSTTPPPAELRESDRNLVAALIRPHITENWPEEELVSVAADSLRLVRKIAHLYTDTSCVELCFDELEAEGRRKLIERFHKGVIEKFEHKDRRKELFKHLAACLNNHLKGILHRCRFTPKRMGRKVPPKGSGIEYNKSWKPEVSLDSPDASATLTMAASQTDVSDAILADMQELLTPLEFIVFRQLTEPNSAAMLDAWIEANRGRARKDQINVSTLNLATGLGMSRSLFDEIVLGVQSKYRKYINTNAEMVESAHHQAVAALERAFDIQIPRATDSKTVARVVTIAARANFDKITPDLADLVRSVGGRPPDVDTAGNPACYGVLWQKNHRVCLTCALYTQCQAESTACGLGEVSIGQSVLPGRAGVRTPSMAEKPATAAKPSVDKPTPSTTTMTPDEERLKTHMESGFRGANFDGERYYRDSARSADGKVKYIFWLGRRNDELRLRFCKPSDKVQAKLECVDRHYYLPTNLEWSEAEKLIEQHASASR